MKASTFPTFSAAGLALLLLLSACGSDGEPVSTGSSSADGDENQITDPAQDELGSTDSTDSTGSTDGAGATADELKEQVLEGSATEDTEDTDDPPSDLVQPIDQPLPDAASDQWQRVADAVDPSQIVDAKPWAIDQALAVSADSAEVVVRFTAGNPPCTQARATVVETNETVEVSLEVGLHPNVAAMSCLAGTSGSEIVVPLEAPIGTRTVTAINP